VRRLAVGALLGLAVVAGVPGVAAVPAAAVEAPSPSPRGTEDSPVEVSIATLAPRFLSQPDEFLQVAGRLTNTGSSPVRDLRLRLVVGERLQSRGDLAQADAEPPPLAPVANTVRPTDRELEPGESVAFDVSVRVRELGLGRLGVYPFGVRVRGTVDAVADTGAQQLGLTQTYLPWFPDGAPQRTRIAWLWPLVDVPHRAPREGIFVDQELQASVGKGGRLSQLVVGAAAGGEGLCDKPARVPEDATVLVPPRPCPAPVPVPVTYAVDPDLLFSVEALSKDHDLLEGDELVEQQGSQDAERWLASLREDLDKARTDLLVLPYADPDVVALSGHPQLDADATAAAQVGATVVQSVVGQVSVLDVAWPPAGPLSQRAFDASLGRTTSAVLLDETAVPPPPGEGPTRDTRVDLPTAVRSDVSGLVIDDALSRLLEPGPATSGKGPRLAEQRWLVETAMVVAEAPSRRRTLVVAPPRRGTVPQSVASAVIADAGRVPWLCPVSLRSVAAGREACPDEAEPTEVRTPEVAGVLEAPDTDALVLPAGLDRVERARVASDQFTDAVLLPGEEATDTKSRLLRARLRTESSAWRDAPAEGRRMLSLLEEDVKSLREQVVVRVGRRVTLTSDKGTIRANLENRLDQRVTVRVRLTAPAARLSVETTPEIVLEPRTVKPVDLEVEALVSGQFVVEAQLLDRQLQPFGDRTRLVVRSTRYGRTALALTGLGAAGLLVAAGVRIVRRALRRPGQDGQDDAPDGEQQAGPELPA
jgi:hypothetical protein